MKPHSGDPEKNFTVGAALLDWLVDRANTGAPPNDAQDVGSWVNDFARAAWEHGWNTALEPSRN